MTKEKTQLKSTVERVYPTIITFRCPSRGIVSQQVMVKRYAAQNPNFIPRVEPEIEELLRTYDYDEED